MPDAVAALRGCMVTRFVLDDALTIALRAAGREASLRIDGAGLLERTGSTHRFSPDADPGSVAPVLALLHARVREVTLAADGSLALDFDGGDRLVALADEHAVSWTVQLTGGASAACLAEGRVVWQ